jgi:hypothetical protein
LNYISAEERKQDLIFHHQRGSQKSAYNYTEVLDKIITEDVEQGFALPLPPAILHLILNASLAPLGCHIQETINERGEKVPKYRMTHDQSFAGPSGMSVNLRVNQDLLLPCMYSFILLRSLHYIVSLRICHPTTKIFISKFDLDAAYRRCHLSGATAQECLSIHNDILLIALRMTFGGSPCPSLWGYISDTVADICNALILNEHCDHRILFDSLSHTVAPPNSLPDTVPFHQAKDLAIKVPINDIGKTEIYLDDTIGIAPDIGDNVHRVSYAIPLAIHSLARPCNSSDPLPRKDITSKKKS